MQRVFLTLAVFFVGCFAIAADLPAQEVRPVTRGHFWFVKGEYDKAIAEYNEALRINPQDADLYYERGLAWYGKDEYDKALADYTQALAINPKSANAYNGRGLAYYKKGDFDKAIADCNQALAIDPNDKYAYNNRGNAWREKGEYDKAIVDYTQALAINPNDKYAYYNRGVTWHKKDAYDKAIADYTQALAISPNHARAWNQLAWLNATCPDAKYRDAKKAFENASKAYQLDGGAAANSIDTLAAAYAANGDFDSARTWEEKAIALATTEKEKAEYRSRLELYKQEKPYRQEPKKK